MQYAELTCKTNFSFLTGGSHPYELIDQAAALGLKALAITDIDGVYAIPKAYWANKKHSLKLIVGCQLTLEKQPPLTLLARDRDAYAILCRLITAAHAGREKSDAKLSLHDLCKWAQDKRSQGLVAILENNREYKFNLMRDLFNDRLYTQVLRIKDGKDTLRYEHAKKIKQTFGIPLVATNDVHYHIVERHKLQDVLTCIRHGKTLATAGYLLFSNHERYLKSPLEMHTLFKDIPDAVHNSVTIADSCTFCPSELRYTYPSEWIPKGHTAQSYLAVLAWQGADKKYFNSIPDKVRRQLEHELQLIDELNFADYFLTIYDIVEFARSRDILCQGRGSAANSVVCYCLGITAIDPVRMNLLFERFISAERGEPPDIDVDFEHERREEVIQYIYEKYGRDRAAMVSAVITYQKRSTLREVCKAFGLPIGTLSARKIERQFDELTRSDGRLQKRIRHFCEEADGFPRHLSIHSGGFTLSANPIVEIVPVEPARMANRTIIQWDKYDLDYLGLLKIDVLGLGMLTAIKKTLKSINLSFDAIPPEDEQTYNMIRHADTVGTFQIESRAQMSMLGRLQPKNFYDLVIQVAIVRPGPIVGKMVHPYLKRRRGEEEIQYHDPRVEKILKKTLGVLLFQEQVMKLAIDLAGFAPGESDRLRRAIAAWRSSGSVHEMGLKLMNGLLKSGLPNDFAQQVFQQIQGFAMYGFPESHAASFALIAYASSYLKCHYPAEFTSAMINSQPLGFYANHTLVDDVKRHGIKVENINPNSSLWDCQVKEGILQLGFRVIKGMQEEEAQSIIIERHRKPFRDLFDFLRRTEIRRHILCRIAMGNGFTCFGIDQRQALWDILEYETQYQNTQQTQISLFEDTPHQVKPSLFEALSEFEHICEDYSAFHLSSHGHPMTPLRKLYPQLPQVTTAQTKSQRIGSHIRIAGMTIIKQKPPTAKGMMFCTLEDESGFLDTAVPPPLVEKYRELLYHHCFFIIEGELQKDGHSISVLIEKLTPIFRHLEDEETTIAVKPRRYFR